MNEENLKGWNEELTISHNGKSFKKVISSINEVFDTIIISIKVPKNKFIHELASDDFYQFSGLINDNAASYQEKNYGFEQYIYKDLGRLLTIRKSLKNFSNNYITLKIKSLHKLVELIGLDINESKYGEEIVDKIVFEIFDSDINRKLIKIRELQPAVDIRFDNNFSKEEFFWFAHDITNVFANLQVKYKVPEFNNSLSTGYFKNRNGDKKIRFYNKANKEKNFEFLNTYRIEYIFDRREIRDKLPLNSNRLDALLKKPVFEFIISDLAKIFIRNSDLLKNTDLKKWKLNKYTFQVRDKPVGGSSWKNEVRISSLLNGSKELFFDESSTYYKNKKSMDYSLKAKMNDEDYTILEGMKSLFEIDYKNLNVA
ncbi:MAG: hypothetical protein ABJK11_07920 [Balneola sp.]